MDLFEFAFVPKDSDWLKRLAASAIKENWGDDLRYLYTYCKVNFRLAYEQGLVYEDPDKRFAIWRVGHLTRPDGTPLYMFFEKNRLEGKQPYYFQGIHWATKLVYQLKGERIPVDPRPAPPRYEVPVYRRDYGIEYNWEHFLNSLLKNPLSSCMLKHFA